MQQESVVRARSLPLDQAGKMVGFTRDEAGWEWMSFEVTRLLPGQSLELRTVDEEMVLVWLGGRCVANWGAGAQSVGARENVFDGLPYSLYLPADSWVTVKAETVCEIAECRVPSKAKLEPRLVTPGDVATGLRGGENASRQIVEVIPSSFAADKLVVFEVYTPGGNWSSYPPHNTMYISRPWKWIWMRSTTTGCGVAAGLRYRIFIVPTDRGSHWSKCTTATWCWSGMATTR
jgi:5-deoxy-D-glucuronate isomerase